MSLKTLKSLLPVLIFCALPGGAAFAQEEARITPITIGQTIEFKSKILGEDRQLNVYLPVDYTKNPNSRYPVIYLLDGSLDEDFIHIAGLTQFGSFPWVKMIPESIVVGIANVDRKRDFTTPPTNPNDKKDYPTAGGTGGFIKSLELEMLPLIRKQYRTNGMDTIIGQSLGGLLATEILFRHPDLFENYIIVSPSLWWNDQALLNSELPKFNQPVSVFIGVGKEGEEMEGFARQLYMKLEAVDDDRIRHFFKYLPELDHGDTLHLAVYNAFESIFSGTSRK